MDRTAIEALMGRGEWDEAMVACRAALQTTPLNARLHGYLGMCLFRKGEFETAIQPFRRATLLDPKFWEAGAKLAQCYDRLRRYEEAFIVAQEWLKVNPRDPTLQGIVHALEGQVENGSKDGWERTGHLHHKASFARDS